MKKQVEELLAKVEAMSKKETDLSYKLAELSDEYKRQGARFKRETEKTKVCKILLGSDFVRLRDRQTSAFPRRRLCTAPSPVLKSANLFLGLCHQKFRKRFISSC